MSTANDTWITVAKSAQFFQDAINQSKEMHAPKIKKEKSSFWSRPGDLFRTSTEVRRMKANLLAGPRDNFGG